jgi:Ulp1 family protease
MVSSISSLVPAHLNDHWAMAVIDSIVNQDIY